MAEHQNWEGCGKMISAEGVVKSVCVCVCVCVCEREREREREREHQ